MRTSDHTVVDTIAGLSSYAGAITMSPDGKFAYLAQYSFTGDDAVLVIDTATNTVVDTITPSGGTTNTIIGQFAGYPLSVYVAAGAPIDALIDAGFTEAELAQAGIASTTSVSTPALNEWGTIIFILLLVASGAWRIKRSRGHLFDL